MSLLPAPQAKKLGMLLPDAPLSSTRQANDTKQTGEYLSEMG